MKYVIHNRPLEQNLYESPNLAHEESKTFAEFIEWISGGKESF